MLFHPPQHYQQGSTPYCLKISFLVPNSYKPDVNWNSFSVKKFMKFFHSPNLDLSSCFDNSNSLRKCAPFSDPVVHQRLQHSNYAIPIGYTPFVNCTTKSCTSVLDISSCGIAFLFRCLQPGLLDPSLNSQNFSFTSRLQPQVFLFVTLISILGQNVLYRFLA